MSTTANIDLVFSALADATRRDILMMLLEDDMAVTDVAEPFDMSLAAISKLFKKICLKHWESVITEDKS